MISRVKQQNKQLLDRKATHRPSNDTENKWFVSPIDF